MPLFLLWLSCTAICLGICEVIGIAQETKRVNDKEGDE